MWQCFPWLKPSYSNLIFFVIVGCFCYVICTLFVKVFKAVMYRIKTWFPLPACYMKIKECICCQGNTAALHCESEWGEKYLLEITQQRRKYFVHWLQIHYVSTPLAFSVKVFLALQIWFWKINKYSKLTLCVRCSKIHWFGKGWHFVSINLPELNCCCFTADNLLWI